MLELDMGNKNKNKGRFIIADKMYYTEGDVKIGDPIRYPCYNFIKPRFTIYDLQK
jgi:hypothetical protein